jgi:hypothetical protein
MSGLPYFCEPFFSNYINKHYLFRLTQTLFITIFSDTTCFDQTDHHQLFILYKNLQLKVKM